MNVLLQSLYRKLGQSSLLASMDEGASWSETNHILARISDGLELSNYLFIKANAGEDGDDLEPPKPLPRPGQQAEEPKRVETEFASGDEVASFFNTFGQV
ncbi:hypothetical protein V7793_04940 [Streptomyces sp. KLMMK]|uniref:hypothetical protein n=1 Tax=Streptomyces sp. KLMMK TaxID=3109353 RepID=UPI0030004766